MNLITRQAELLAAPIRTMTNVIFPARHLAIKATPICARIWVQAVCVLRQRPVNCVSVIIPEGACRLSKGFEMVKFLRDTRYLLPEE